MSFPRDRSAANDVKPTGKLTVENLHYEVSQSELQQLFEQIGPVVKAYIKVRCSAESKCYVSLTRPSILSLIVREDRLAQQLLCTRIPTMPLRPRENTTVPKRKVRLSALHRTCEPTDQSGLSQASPCSRVSICLPDSTGKSATTYVTA